MMDIDIQDQLLEDIESQGEGSGGTRSESKKPIRVVVDDAHPFELESYIAGYTGTCARFFFVLGGMLIELNDNHSDLVDT